MKQALRHVARQLPQPARRVLSTALHRLNPWDTAPIVSLVVPVAEPQADFLDECLDSLRAQTHRNLDILVLPHGASRKAREVAREHAAHDRRIRLHPHDVENLGQARNLGAASARGQYLAFVGAADRLPMEAVQKLVASLQDSGSDFAVGRLSEVSAPVGLGGSGRQAAHRHNLRGISIAEFPVAITDAFVENRLFRTAFWKSAGLRFQQSQRTAVGSPVVEAYLRATSFDILSEVTYRWMKRGDGLPFGHLSNAMEDLDEWLAAQRETATVLERSVSGAVRDAWLYGVLDSDAVPFLDDVERADDRQWAALSEQIRALAESAGAEVWSRVRAEPRVKVWLASHDRRTELEEFVARRWFEFDNTPTDVRDGVVYAALPFYGDRSVGIPDSCFVMSEAETPLNVSLRAVRWCGSDTIELDVYAIVRFVAFDDEAPELEVAIVDQATQARTPLKVRGGVDPLVTRASGHRYQNYDRGAFTVTVDAAALAAAAPDTGMAAGASTSWWFEFTLTTRGLSRSGTIIHRSEQGSAGALRTGSLAPRTVGRHRIDLAPDPDVGIRVVTTPGPAVELASVEIAGRVVRGRLGAPGRSISAVRATRPGAEAVQCETSPTADGIAFSFELPELAAATDGRVRPWRLRALETNGSEEPIGWPRDTWDSWLGVGTANTVAMHRSPQGNCEISEVAHSAVLDTVSVEADGIHLHGRWLGAAPAAFSLELSGRRARLDPIELLSDELGFEAVFPAQWDEWGTGPSAIPVGHYWCLMTDSFSGTARTAGVPASQRLLDRLPEESLGADFRLRVVRGVRGVGVEVSAPLADDEKGPSAQKRLQNWFTGSSHPIDENAVYLQSYAGATATDSQLAIHQELRRTPPGPHALLGGRRPLVPVPEGGVPGADAQPRVVRRAGTARTSSTTSTSTAGSPSAGAEVAADLPRLPGQVDGDPDVGAKKFTPRRIEAELDAHVRDWDLILTPAPEMDEYYRAEYAYDGEILSHGYPRDDVLVRDGGADPAETRDGWASATDQTVVLYAPTWRDDLATELPVAPLVAPPRPRDRQRGAWDDYVLLLRGHRFHARGPSAAGGRPG